MAGPGGSQAPPSGLMVAPSASRRRRRQRGRRCRLRTGRCHRSECRAWRRYWSAPGTSIHRQLPIVFGRSSGSRLASHAEANSWKVGTSTPSQRATSAASISSGAGLASIEARRSASRSATSSARASRCWSFIAPPHCPIRAVVQLQLPVPPKGTKSTFRAPASTSVLATSPIRLRSTVWTPSPHRHDGVGGADLLGVDVAVVGQIAVEVNLPDRSADRGTGEPQFALQGVPDREVSRGRPTRKCAGIPNAAR